MRFIVEPLGEVNRLNYNRAAANGQVEESLLILFFRFRFVGESPLEASFPLRCLERPSDSCEDRYWQPSDPHLLGGCSAERDSGHGDLLML